MNNANNRKEKIEKLTSVVRKFLIDLFHNLAFASESETIKAFKEYLGFFLLEISNHNRINKMMMNQEI